MADSVFSKQLQKLRRAKGDTQEQLAAFLSVSPQAVSKWENGSYPDGDLLPKIADYFGVSIDYLYGKDKREVPLLQQVLEMIQSIPMGENYCRKENFEQMLRVIWAMQAGSWGDTKEYYERNRSQSKETVASVITDQAGFTYMRLNQNFEHYTLMKEPEGGFSNYFKVTPELVELFEKLADEDNLRILFYMMSLGVVECVSAATVSERLNVDRKKSEEILNYFCQFSERGNGMLFAAKLLTKEDTLEKVYTVQQPSMVAVLMLLAGADAMLNPPNSFCLQIGNRGTGWFDRKAVEPKKKTSRKERESGKESKGTEKE